MRSAEIRWEFPDRPNSLNSGKEEYRATVTDYEVSRYLPIL